MKLSSLIYLGKSIVLAALYFAGGRLGLELAALHGNVSLVWPPTGIALAGLICLGCRFWPAIAVGAFLVNALTAVSVLTALGIAAGNTLEALAGSYLVLRYANPQGLFDDIKGVLQLVIVALLASMISSTIGVTSLCSAGSAPWSAYVSLWLDWWVGDAMGALVIAPLVLTWWQWPRLFRLRPSRLLEAVTLLAFLVIISLAVFSQSAALTPYPGSAYVVFPLVIWAALRFGPQGATLVTLVIASLAIWSTTHNAGPFAVASFHEGLMTVQSFTAMVALTALFLTAAVSQRRRAEEELRASEERYRELFENANDTIYTHNLAGIFTSINKSGQETTGYTWAEFVQMNIIQLIAPEHLEAARRQIDRKRTGEARRTTYELEIVARDGRRIPVEVSTRLIYQGGKSIGVQGIARDITKRRRLEERLRHTQKLEAIGRLAGGVAHEFNNLLTGILGYSDLLLQEHAGGPFTSDLAEIKKLAERASLLTRQLLTFGRRQDSSPKPLNLTDVLCALANLLRRLVGSEVELFLETCSDLGFIVADPLQIEQILINLAINARDAMLAGGKLTIQTANVELDNTFGNLSDQVSLGPGPCVMLSVSDTGCGMNADVQSHLFEPFFTTKDKEKGTGLGLSTVYGCVQQNSGHIEVASQPGNGTTFKIWFPRLRDQREQATDEWVKREGIRALRKEPGGAVAPVSAELSAS